MNATDFYRKLNTENKIKDFGGYGDFTPDQMIWFAEEYAKQLAIPIEPPVGMPEPNPSFGQWVEAEYKLPDDGEEVIFINPDKHIRIGEYSDDEFMQGYWVNKCEQYLTKDIKRWMPLPKSCAKVWLTDRA